MGVCFVSVSATDEMIARVHSDPPLIWRLYEPDEEELYLSEIGAGKRPGLLARLLGAKESPIPQPLPSFEYTDDSRLEVDLDKSWDGLNYCLKQILGSDALNLFEDGRKIDTVEVGYGPAMTFTGSETKRIYEAYKTISTQELVSRLNPADMKKVYLAQVWKRNEDEAKEYAKNNYEALQSYLEAVAKKSMGIVVVYT